MYRLNAHIPNPPDYRIKTDLFLSPQQMLKIGLSNNDNIEKLRSWVNSSDWNSSASSVVPPVSTTASAQPYQYHYFPPRAPALSSSSFPPRSPTYKGLSTLATREVEPVLPPAPASAPPTAGRQKTPMPQPLPEAKKPSSPSIVADEPRLKLEPRLKIEPVRIDKKNDPEDAEPVELEQEEEHEESEDSNSEDNQDGESDMFSAKAPDDEYEPEDDIVEGEHRIDMPLTLDEVENIDDMNRYLQSTDRYKNFVLARKLERGGTSKK